MADRWTWLWVLVFLLWAAVRPPGPRWIFNAKRIAFNEAGYQYYRESRFNLAQGKFEKALEYNRLIDRRSGIASNLNNLGVIAQAQGDTEAGRAPASGKPWPSTGSFMTPPPSARP